MTRHLVLLTTVLLLSPAPDADPDGSPGPPAGPATPVQGPAAPPADHHMHVWTPEARDALARLLVAGRDAEPPDLPTFDGDGVVARLDSAGIGRGVILSTAYLFGSPDVDFEGERSRVRRENGWVARQAARHPDRLVAFFSANPLADYAADVVGRCADAPECRGMKVHLANADFDFHDEAHVERLRAFFRRSNESGLPIVIHLQTRREDYGAAEVDVFVDRVLPAAPDVTVQVAHMGGNSRFDAATVRAFDELAAALEDHPERTDDLYFDMGLVPFPPQRARGDSTRRVYRTWNRRFAEAVRRVGPDRVLFGTDYPEAEPGPYARRLRSALPLTEGEVRDLYDDRAPYLR